MLAALACLGAEHFLATRYAPINWLAGHAAWGFGLQAVVMASVAVFGTGSWSDGRGRDATVIGWGLVGYATLLHPFVGLVFGRPLAQAGIVGIAPDPTALACLGILSLVWPGRWGLACSAIPFLWCAFSAATLLTLDDPQGWILITGVLLWTLARSLSIFQRT